MARASNIDFSRVTGTKSPERFNVLGNIDVATRRKERSRSFGRYGTNT